MQANLGGRPGLAAFVSLAFGVIFGLHPHSRRVAPACASWEPLFLREGPLPRPQLGRVTKQKLRDALQPPIQVPDGIEPETGFLAAALFALLRCLFGSVIDVVFTMASPSQP